MSSFWAIDTGYVMWVSIGNTIIFVAFIYVFFWIPMIPPKKIATALNESAIELAGSKLLYLITRTHV